MKKKPKHFWLDLSQILGKYLHKHWRKNLEISYFIYHNSMKKKYHKYWRTTINIDEKPRHFCLDLSQIHGRYLHKPLRKKLEISCLIYHNSMKNNFINIEEQPKHFWLDLSQIHGKYLHKHWRTNLEITRLIYHNSMENTFINIEEKH